MMGTVDYQVQRTPCPQCGDNSQVHNARELFDTLNSAPQTAFQRFSQAMGQAAPGQAGPGQAGTGQPQGQGGFHAAPFEGPGGNSPTGQPQGQGGNTAGGPPPASPPPAGPPQAGQPGAQPGQAWPAADQGQGQNQAWGPADQGFQPIQPGHPNDGSYDNYNAENTNRWNNINWRKDILRPEKLADDVGDAVVGTALGFAGRAIGRRMKKAFEEKIMPAMEARAQQMAQQSGAQSEQAKADQEAIIARYPELRGCLKDQVIFLDGGYKTIPVSELTMPLTLDQADAIVARLR